MNNEISEEANLPRRKALQRLERDGAQSRPAMQRRVRALAAERSIPTADFHKLMYKRPSTQAVMDFCKKHKVSADWLLCGDLKGLARMERERKQAAAVASHPGGASGYFLKVFCGLNAKQQELALVVIRKLATEEIDD
jgi:hypothetical protein